MTRITQAFKTLKKQNKSALITYITAGDPSLAVTEKLVYELEKNGADIIELGIPFSDPLADGPIIQASHQRALEKNVNLEKVFQLLKTVREKSSAAIVFMLDINLILQYQVSKFFNDAKHYGLDGVIIPDLPPEEAQDFIKSARKNNVDIIFLAAPTSSNKRLKLITKLSSGFLYLISLTGVTGARKRLSSEVGKLVKKIKQFTKLPVCVGFGISTPTQAKEISKIADGVIVGSAIVKIIENNVGKSDLVKKVSRFSKLISKELSPPLRGGD